MSEISGKAGENTSVCSAYIKNLMALGLVKKETPYGEKESRKSVYTIADHMFRFWYRFIPENSSVIGRGAADLAYRRIAPNLPDFRGKHLRISVRNIFGSCCWKAIHQWSSPLWADGGERIRQPGGRKRLILWENRTAAPHCLENVSGDRNRWMPGCWRPW